MICNTIIKLASNTQAFQSFKKSTKITIKKRIRFTLFWQIRLRTLSFRKRYILQKKIQSSRKFFFIQKQLRDSPRRRNLRTHFFFQSFYGHLSIQYVRNLYKMKKGISYMRLFRFLISIESQLVALIYRLFFVKTINQAYEYIKKRKVFVNGNVCQYPKRIVLPGDVISFSEEVSVLFLTYVRNHYQFLERGNNLSIFVKKKKKKKNQFFKITKKGRITFIQRQIDFMNNEYTFATKTVFPLLQKEIYKLCGRTIKDSLFYNNQSLRILLVLDTYRFFFFAFIQKVLNNIKLKHMVNFFDIMVILYILNFLYQERLLKNSILTSSSTCTSIQKNCIEFWKKRTGFLFSLIDFHFNESMMYAVKKRKKFRIKNFKFNLDLSFTSLIFYFLLDKQTKRKNYILANSIFFEKKSSKVFSKELGFSLKKISNNLKKGNNTFTFLYRLCPINVHVDYTIGTVSMLYHPQVILIPKPLITGNITKAYR